MQTSNFPPKYVDTLRTSDMYEKDIRHRKSEFFVDGMAVGAKYLSGLWESSQIQSSIVIKPAAIFPINVNHLDYVHMTDKSRVRMIKMGASPDYLTPGCKVKFR